MPAIKVCRDCHTGSTPVSNKLVSDCGLCHGFHLPGHEASKGSTRQDTLKSIIKSALDKTTVKPDTSTSGTIKSSSAQLNEGEMH